MNKRVIQSIFVIVIIISLSACGEAEPAPTPVPPTATPSPIPPTETPTLIPPTETPLPSPTPEGFPGWKKFEAGGVELWLPESFEGGDLSQDLDLIVDVLADLGPEFEQYAQLIEQNPEIFLLFAIDTNLSPAGVVTNVNLGKVPVLSALTIQMYIDASLSQIPEAMEVIGTEVITIAGQQTGIIELAYALEGIDIHQLLYIFKQGTNLWQVTYTTSEADFEENLPIFEQSISTFKIVE